MLFRSGGAREQRGREKSKGHGTDDGVSTAEASAETVQNLEELHLNIDREDRYVLAALKAFPASGRLVLDANGWWPCRIL